MTDRDEQRARYPLRAVIQRTGLSADVIRAWERRHGAVAPQRSAGGQRLYTEDDVLRLSLLQRATAGGHSIAEIARLDAAALERLLDRRGSHDGRKTAEVVDTFVAEATAAAQALDADAIERALKRALLALGADQFLDHAVGRFLREIGDRWRRGTMSPAHEHLASVMVRRVLGWMSEAYDPSADAPRVVVATPAGELHELGAMAAAATALSVGWRAVYLGPNLPAADIATSAERAGARLVALSVVYAHGEAAVQEVREAARLLRKGAGLVIGGSAAEGMARAAAQWRVRVLPDLVAFRQVLREMGARRPRKARSVGR